MPATRSRWIEDAASVDIVEVVASLGVTLTRSGNSLVGLCPLHLEKTGSFNVTHDKGLWYCHGACQCGGDGPDLVARYLYQRPVKDCDRDQRSRIRAWYADHGYIREESSQPASQRSVALAVQERPERPRLQVVRVTPPADELAAVWRLSRSVLEDDDAMAWLEGRGLCPEDVAQRGLARVLPPLPPRGSSEPPIELPEWARYWQRYHRVLIPLRSTAGAMVSIRARALLAEAARKKALNPTGFSVAGLVLDAGERTAQLVVIAEGEPDWLSWACRADLETTRVLGISSGGWTPEIAATIADGATVAVRVHHDAAGEKYAAAVIESLAPRPDANGQVPAWRVHVLRSQVPDPATDDENDRLRRGTLPLDPTEDAYDVGAPPPPRAALASAYVLVPGYHVSPIDGPVEQSRCLFGSGVLAKMPAHVLYRHGWQIVGTLRGDLGHRVFGELDHAAAAALVDKHAKLAHWTPAREKKPAELIYESCSKTNGEAFVEECREAPQVHDLEGGVVGFPVFVADDQDDWASARLCSPGWNPGSKLYYDEAPELQDLEPARGLTPDYVRAIFDDLFVDFPLATEADRQNMIGLLLTPLVRPLCPTSPPHMVLSSLERTGKSLLLSSTLGGILGRPPGCVQLGTTEEEKEKRITSLMIEGCRVINFDNLPIKSELDSASIASLATAETWKGRRLGMSEMPEMRNVLTICLSGNNVSCSGEILKRTVPIRLQPATDTPELRDTFAHPDIARYVRQRRRLLLEIMTGMVTTWLEAGCPPPLPRLGGFERWVQIVGGTLAHYGLTDWLANQRAWVGEGDEFSADSRVLVATWWQKHGRTPIRLSDIHELVETNGLFSHILDRGRKRKEDQEENGRRNALSRKVVKPLCSRPVGDYRVVKTGAGTLATYHLWAQATDNVQLQPSTEQRELSL